VHSTGVHLKSSRRCWPHAEGLKANIVEGKLGRRDTGKRAIACLDKLSGTFLGKPFPAGWIDRVDAGGKSLVDFVPASTLYHVYCALTEAVAFDPGTVAQTRSDRPGAKEWPH
jgi:mannose-6-phosphate isomerase